MILDEDIERVRDSADIVHIIGEHVKLKRVGTSYRGPCPFHGGSGPNFSVMPGKGFKCFVCGEGGDVFTFLQKQLGMDWPSAVRLVAERVGVQLREVDTRKQEGPDPREPLWEANAAAAEFFADMLWNDSAGAAGREYLAARDVPRELGNKIGLGFAPRDASPFMDHFRSLGYDEHTLLEAGIMAVREGQNPRPRFRNRLMFPILDAQGRHVGFGGRVVGGGEPKYLNSPESPVFSKGKLLYGHYWARNAIRKHDRVLVVEGYFDALRLHAVGIDEAVAPLGTALTDAQALLLVRATKNVFLLYDSDQAGLKATFRAGDELLRHSASVRVVSFPEGEDPDTYARTHGREKVESLLNGAVDVFERKVQILDRSGWFATLDKKRRALDRLIPTIRAAADPLTRDLYLGRAADAAGVSRELLAREVDASPSRRGAAPPEPPLRPDQDVRRPVRDRRGGERRASAEPPPAETGLLRVMIHARGHWEDIFNAVPRDTFHDARARAIFDALRAQGAEFDTADLLAELDEDSAELVQRWLDPDLAIGNPRQTVEDSVRALRRRELDERSARIDELLPLASDEEQNQLILEKTALQKQREAIGGGVLRLVPARNRPQGRSGAS